MADPFVAISKVVNGSMHNRNNPLDEEVIASRTEWLRSLDLDIYKAARVRVSFEEGDNYCRYREVDTSNMGEGMFNADSPAADALVTTTPGMALFLPIADCVATTIFDEDNGVLMLTHLGRQSLEQEGGVRSVEYLKERYGSKPENLKIWLSPTVNKDAYKIYKLDNKGMKEVLYEQLEKAGVDLANVIDNKDDTATNPEYYSYSEFLKGNKPIDGCYAMVAVMPV